MAGKLLNLLTQNLLFKILAVGLAFILWLVVYNIDDPKVTQTYTTNVTIENASVVTELNKCYEVMDNSNVVTFAVTAKRSVLKNLEDTDFRAVADLNRMVIAQDKETATVPVEITSIRSNNSLSYPGKKFLKLSLEDLMSKRLVVAAAVSGSVADGYALGEATVTNPNVLKVSGPASIVSQIVSAVATIDVDGMSVNLSDNVVPVMLDADGREVDTTRLTVSNTTVTVVARILMVKELPLSFSTTGTPDGDFSVVGITSDPTIIRVKGASAVLNPVTGITVPGTMIDVTGAREDIATTIDISEFLPAGVELVDAASARVTVTVRIEAYKTLGYMVDVNHIMVEGLAGGYELKFRNQTAYVAVSGLQMDLDELSSDTLTGSIDVTGLGAGVHRVVLKLNIDEERYIYQTVSIEVEIWEDGAAQPPQDADAGGGEDEPPTGDDTGLSQPDAE